MSIKVEILEKFASLSSEKEIKSFLSEIILALHEINNVSLESMVKSGTMSQERSNAKQEETNALLKQIVDNIYENIKINNLAKKDKEYDALKKENEILASKVDRAIEMLKEKDVEIEKTKKATQTALKRKLQIGRDKIIAIAETSTVLGEHISDEESIGILNNIRENVGLLTEEMLSLGLWDEDETKPNVSPIVAKVAVPVSEPAKEEITAEEIPAEVTVEEMPKKKTTKKTTKKVATKENVEEKADSLDDVDSLDDDLSAVNTTDTEGTQLSLLDAGEDTKQEN